MYSESYLQDWRDQARAAWRMHRDLTGVDTHQSQLYGNKARSLDVIVSALELINQLDQDIDKLD